MTVWLVPHVVWCLHGTVVAPKDLLLASYRPVIASVMAAAIALAVFPYFGRFDLPIVRLLMQGGIMLGLYLGILLFAMGQKAFYLDLLRGLRGVPRPA
jgi:PST family polysaccharide transporter